MGCQGGRGTASCVLVALLLAACGWAAPASANAIVVNDVQTAESGHATFTITREAGLLSGATSVAYRTVDGSAGASDYAGSSGTLAFGSAILGETQRQQVAIAIAPDALDEPDETFRIVLAGSEVTDGDGVATIDDDDPVPSLSVADSPAVTEGAAGAKAAFVVRLSTPSGRAVAVSYATANGGATAGQDYAARSGALVLPAGSTQATVDVSVLDDALDEPAEAFELRLSSATAATIADGVASATIADDDEPPPPPPAASLPTTGSGQPSTPAGTQPAPAPTTGSSLSRPALGLSSPRLKRPATVLVTISCPQNAGRCSGRVTLFSVANRRSRVKALRKERKLGRLEFALQAGRAQTLELKLGRTDLALLRRTGRMQVRAYAITRDGAGRTGVRSVNGTLIARTAHSSPSRGTNP